MFERQLSSWVATSPPLVSTFRYYGKTNTLIWNGDRKMETMCEQAFWAGGQNLGEQEFWANCKRSS